MTFGAHTAQFSHPRPADGRGAGGERWQPLNSSLARLMQFPLRLERGEGGVRCRIQTTPPLVAANSISSVLKTTFPEAAYGL